MLWWQSDSGDKGWEKAVVKSSEPQASVPVCSPAVTVVKAVSKKTLSKHFPSLAN
jgi:hypothetical protein